MVGKQEVNFCSHSMDFHRPVVSKVGYRTCGELSKIINCDSEKQILKKDLKYI